MKNNEERTVDHGTVVAMVKKSGPSAIAPVMLRTTKLASSVDAAGFPFAAVVDSTRRQASVGLIAEDCFIESGKLHHFEAAMSQMEDLVAVVSIVDGGASPAPARLWATFRAVRKEHRDEADFVNELAKRSTAIFSAAADSGIETTLMTKQAVMAEGARAWSPEAGASWPPTARTVTEQVKAISVDGIARSVFEVDTSSEIVEAQIEELLSAIDVGPTLHFVRTFRPGEIDCARGRRGGVLVFSLPGDLDSVIDISTSVLTVLAPEVELRVRPLMYRQQLGAGMAAGAGVLGWQHVRLTAKAGVA